jgi:hypothetical protein
MSDPKVAQWAIVGRPLLRWYVGTASPFPHQGFQQSWLAYAYVNGSASGQAS